MQGLISLIYVLSNLQNKNLLVTDIDITFIIAITGHVFLKMCSTLSVAILQQHFHVRLWSKDHLLLLRCVFQNPAPGLYFQFINQHAASQAAFTVYER